MVIAWCMKTRVIRCTSSSFKLGLPEYTTTTTTTTTSSIYTNNDVSTPPATISYTAIVKADTTPTANMDILPSGNIFRELQDIHDTGYFSSQASIEDQWQQVSFVIRWLCIIIII